MLKPKFIYPKEKRKCPQKPPHLLKGHNQIARIVRILPKTTLKSEILLEQTVLYQNSVKIGLHCTRAPTLFTQPLVVRSYPNPSPARNN